MCCSGFGSNRSCRTVGATPTISIGLRLGGPGVGAELQHLPDRILVGEQRVRERLCR